MHKSCARTIPKVLNLSEIFSEFFPKAAMEKQNKRIYKFDEFQIDVPNRQLRRDDNPVSLPARAFDLLLALVENNGRLVGKDELFSRVWNDQIVEESNLTVHVSQIRKALGEKSRTPRYIETVPGFGYRFVGAIENFDGDDLVIETRTLSRIVIEKEEEVNNNDLKKDSPILLDQNFNLENGNQPDVGIALKKSKTFKSGFAKYVVTMILVFSVCLMLAFSAYQYFNGKKTNAPFQKIKLARLTNNGKTTGVTISPDGKYIVYVLSETEGNSLWAQQVGTAASIRLVPPFKALVWGLTFTPDGKHIFYNLFAGDKADTELFRVSSLGGVSEKVPNVISSYISFAPDGKRFAYIQSDSAGGYNYLVIADANGSNQKVIAKKKQPNTFESQVPVIAWSPDGEVIACLVNHFEADASYSSIVGINVRDGSEKSLSENRWYNVFNLEWLKNGGGLIFTGSEKNLGGSQIRFLSYPGGEAAQITNDLNQYEGLSATADGESFVTIQTNTISGIFVGETGAEDFREIISETGALQPFVWTPDGKIIFRSTADGSSNLWKIDADGGNRRQLTTNAQVDSGRLCVSPDGKYLVFASWRLGKTNLWRVAAAGGDLTQLTDGEADTRPQCTPDGQSVVYQSGLHSKPQLWKVPLAGGEAVRLTDFYAKWASISNDGSRISYLYMTDDKWRIGIISSAGGSMLQGLDVPSDLREPVIHWSPDNQSLFYAGEAGNVGNVRSLPLDGSAPKPLTNFKTHSLDNFSWSSDGKSLAVSRNTNVSDVILVENVK